MGRRKVQFDVKRFAKLIGKRYNDSVEGGCVNFAVAAIKVLREEGLNPEFIMVGWDHAAIRVGGVEFDGVGLLTPMRVQTYERNWNKSETREIKDNPGHVPLPGRFITTKEFIDHPGGGGGTFEVDSVTMPFMWSDVCYDEDIEDIVHKLKSIIASMERKAALAAQATQKVALKIEGEGDNLIAYRDRVFRFTDANDDVDRETVNAAVGFLGLTRLDGDDVWDLQNAIHEQKPEVLVGHIDGAELVITTQSDYRHGRGSRLLLNLLRELGLSGARMGDFGETSEEMPVGEVTGDLPDTLLHGTTSEHMAGILRNGLTADATRSNYSLGRTGENTIEHGDTVFLTESPDKAEYHAVNAVHQLGARRTPGHGSPYSARDAQAGFPVIVKFTIPDKDKLVPDYDIDVWSDSGEGSFDSSKMQRQRQRDTGYAVRTEEDPFKLSKKFGIFGYRGRIPASFIKSIMIQTGEEETEGFQPSSWTTVTREQLEKAIEYGDALAWAYEDTCPECGDPDDDCSCDRCEECGDREWECACEEDATVAAYWKVFNIVADSPEEM